MIEEELIRIWQSSPNQERANFEKSRLMIDVQSSMDHFHKKIKHRDLREQIAILIVIPAFAYSAYALPHILSKLASVLIICWAVYVAIRLRNAKKYKPGSFTETYINYLHQTKDYLLIEKQMLESVLYWYILPGMTLVTLFLMGFAGIPGKLSGIFKTSALNVALAFAVYFLNKRSVQTQINPRLMKVGELIDLMEKSL